MTVNPSVSPASAKPVSPLLYPTLLIAGICVIIASLLGVAAMTGLLPQVRSQASSQTGTDNTGGATPLRAKAAPEKTAATRSAGVSPVTAPAAARCTDCGVVESVKVIETRGEGTGVGAVAGGVVGGILGNQVGGGRGRTAMTVMGAGAGAYAGHELEKNAGKSISYEIRVRMDDNSYRTLHAGEADVDVGQRVRIRDGRLAPV